jgi:hypothetical protein
MPMYQVVNALSLKNGERIIKAGTRSPLEEVTPKYISALLRTGAIREVASPPLATLAGWKTRALRLAKHDVVTLQEFLETDETDLARWLRVRPATVRRYKKQLEDWNESGEAKPRG